MKWFGNYVGIPFETGGRSWEGCDCYGLVYLVLKERYFIELPMLNNSYSNALDTTMVHEVIKHNKPLLRGSEENQPKEGCVVVMSSGTSAMSSHIGICVTDTLILHATQGMGACVEPFSELMKRKKIEGIYNVNKSYSTNRSV